MFKTDVFRKLLDPSKRTNRITICELCGAKPEMLGQPIGMHTDAQTGEECGGTLMTVTQQSVTEGLARHQPDLNRNHGPFC